MWKNNNTDNQNDDNNNQKENDISIGSNGNGFNVNNSSTSSDQFLTQQQPSSSSISSPNENISKNNNTTIDNQTTSIIPMNKTKNYLSMLRLSNGHPNPNKLRANSLNQSFIYKIYILICFLLFEVLFGLYFCSIHFNIETLWLLLSSHLFNAFATVFL
jgi:hypothetical protein